MNALLSDLMHDLREKRLWPVAALLVIALIAVPVLLAKPAPETSSSEPTSAPATSAAEKPATAVVKLADLDEIQKTSKLQVFDPKDPFKPKMKQVKLSAATAQALTEIAANAPESGGGEGGSTDGGGTGGSTGGLTEPAPLAPAPDGPTKVAQFTYVIDVTFESDGKRRKIKGMDRLSMLPSQTNPALLFLGVDSSGDDAVFLVDSTLSATGEGSCSPSAKECATLALGAGSEHFFTDEKGNSYSLRVDEIRKVKVSKASAAAAKRAKSARRTGVAATANAAATPIRRFVPPILADLVTVASPGTNGSSSDKDRR